MLSIGDDEDHSLAIYDWLNKKLIASAKTSRYKVTDCEFKSDFEFATCGLGHMKFWSFKGANINFHRGLMGSGQFEPLTCVAFAFPSKICVTGTTKGCLVVWNGHEIQRKVPAHKSQGWILTAKGNGLVSGGQDGNLIVCSNDFIQLSSIEIST